jgi:tetratricopeptide (TPR) repeat protein
MRLQVSSEAAGSGKARPGRLFALVFGAVVGVSIGGCSTLGDQAGDQASAGSGAARKAGSARGDASPTITSQALDDADDVTVRRRGGPIQGSYQPEGLPNVALTPPLLLKILAAEIGLQRQQLSTSYATYQDLAVRTRDARLARRATEIALAGRAFEQALASAKLWSELDPASTESQQTVETLQLATGKLKDVEPALARRLALAREEGNLDEAYLQLQRTLTRIQDRKEGWALLQRISQPDLRVVAARLARASVAAAADQKEAAAAEAMAAVELAPKDASAAIAAAQYTQELPEGGPRAAALLESFLRRSPDNQIVGLALGRLYLSEDEFGKARATLERVLQKDPENPQVLYSLAQASYQAKDIAAAQGYLKRYVDLPASVSRENAPAYLFLSQIAEEDNRVTEAISWLEQIQGGDLYISSVSRRAQLTAREGDFDKARQLIKDTTPRNQRERLALVSAEAQVLREAKRYQDAFDLLDAAVTKEPNAPDLLYDHAMAAERIDDIAMMEKSLRKLIELRPDSAHAYNALGYTLADRNQRLPEALELIKKAVALMPDDPQIIDSLGWVHYRMGDMDKALKYLREAYAAKPDVEVAAHLGEVLWTTGARDEALKVWREASGREPKNEVLRGTLARLNVSL